jgi:aminoglycoside 6'-N-acetyltransferase
VDAIRGARVVLRRLAPEDRAALLAIFAEPSVARRWLGTIGLEATVDGLFADDDHVGYAILVEDEVTGYIQYAEEPDADYRHASIDIGLGERWQGRGLGTDAVRSLARHLIHERGHHRLTIDPAADNAPAIRAYEKAGFRPVGVMRRYERGPDGTWHDGLLMDLLADDLPAHEA